MNVSKKFQGNIKGVSTKIEGCCKGVQGPLKEVENVCQGGFNGVSRPRVIH